MNNRTVQLNQIPPSTYLVKGILSFSRLTSKVEGEELVKDQQRRQSNGLRPIEKPYTSVTVHNAQIVQMNPNMKTPAEIYGEESFYQSKNNNNNGYSFSAINKGNGLPWIGVSNDGGKTVNQIIPDGELANELQVIVVMRIFKSSLNNGQSVDGIILLEPPKYYTNATNNLAQYGITFNPIERPVETVGEIPTPVPAQQTPNVAPATPFNTQSANPFSNPAQAPTPVANSPFGQPIQPNGFPNGIQYTPNN